MGQPEKIDFMGFGEVENTDFRKKSGGLTKNEAA